MTREEMYRRFSLDTSMNGKRFGMLVVRGSTFRTYGPKGRQKRRFAVVKCECGELTIAFTGNFLRRNDGCGCVRRNNGKKKRTHGHTSTTSDGKRVQSRTYNSWANMVNRCDDPLAHNYKYYGGRGISVCQRWLGDGGFDRFLADMGERPEGKTLDRIDNNGNYEPSNCQWADKFQQSRNRRPQGTC